MQHLLRCRELIVTYCEVAQARCCDGVQDLILPQMPYMSNLTSRVQAPRARQIHSDVVSMRLLQSYTQFVRPVPAGLHL